MTNIRNLPRMLASLPVALFLALNLTGCGEGDVFERFEPGYRDKARARVEGVLRTFRGASEQWLIGQLGRPRNVYDYANGGRYVVFRSGNATFWCEVKATLDSAGRVSEAGWRDSQNLGGLRECDVWLSYVEVR